MKEEKAKAAEEQIGHIKHTIQPRYGFHSTIFF
jgi:hypothetical protein